jgi:menaquinone-dependent protoporphyrinogen IX oxidase
MKKILVAYATSSGSTAEVAEAVAEEIARCNFQADVLPIGDVQSLEGYDGVVVGGPMIMGWHRSATGFLKHHRAALQSIPFAVFVTAMSLTQAVDTAGAGVPLYIDAKLPEPPKNPGRLSLRERYATPANYARPILGAARPAQPASLAFFGGRLDYGRLKWWGVLFAMVIIGAAPGERRNWPAIRAWAGALPATLHLTTPEAEAPEFSAPVPALA